MIDPVTIAERKHLYPSRTQKLSSPAPMILGGKLPGKVGRCRFIKGDSLGSPFFVVIKRQEVMRMGKDKRDIYIRPGKTALNLATNIFVDIVAGLLIGFGTYNFTVALEFPMVGIGGIALIFYHLFNIPIGVSSMVLNVPIAMICCRFLGKDFFLSSIRSIIITSLIIDTVSPLFPLFTGDRMLAAICAGVLSGIGYGMIYMRNSSTGGTDFIVMSIKKIHPHLTIGKISFAMEAFVIAAGTIAVSRQVENLIYGMIISFIMSTVVDKVMYGLSAGKMALIVTTEPYEVAEKISQTTERGCTFIEAQGSYSEEEREVVMCACSNKQMFAIRSAVREVDPDAFIVILDSNEVVGEGFKKM